MEVARVGRSSMIILTQVAAPQQVDHGMLYAGLLCSMGHGRASGGFLYREKSPEERDAIRSVCAGKRPFQTSFVVDVGGHDLAPGLRNEFSPCRS